MIEYPQILLEVSKTNIPLQIFNKAKTKIKNTIYLLRFLNPTFFLIKGH
jgi:hypothetical protein